MALVTSHLRIREGVLEQLVVFSEDDKFLLEKFDLDDVDEDVFRDQAPTYSCRDWLSTIHHKWRTVFVVT